MNAGEAHLWLADPEAAGESYGRLFALLDTGEQARARRFHFDVHRRQFVAAHALARLALEHHGGHPATSWRFEAGPHGRPEIVDPRSDLRFNISHTDGLVACLVGRGAEIGVDVEHTDRGGSLLDVAERYFSADEVQALRRLPPESQPHRFLEYWTLKEAYIKARGLGLALPLGQFTFLLDERPRVGVSFAPELGDDPARWHFTLAARGGRHLVASAIAPGDGRPRTIVPRDGDQLLRA